MKRALIYVRVSTQEQAREGFSVEEQTDRLSKYCAARDWTVAHIYVDAGYSGGTTDRPALQNMIKAVKAKSSDTVVVYKLDRLSRSQKDTLELIEDVFLKNGCDFVSMCEQFDTATPFGRAMIGILAVFAQLEREQIKERMSMGRDGRAKSGKYHGGSTIPIGYDYANGELVVNEYEAMQVRELFERFLRGESLRSIANDFNDKGYTHHHGNWQATTMSKLIRHPVYTGKVQFDGKVYQGNHEPIIDVETFERANRLLDDRHAAAKANNRNSSATYLGGLIRCKQCGARYGINRVRSKGSDHVRSYYCCYSRRKQNRSMVKDPTCKNKIWRMKDLDDLIFGEIAKLAVDPNYTNSARCRAVGDAEDKRKILLAEIEKVDSQRSRLADLYALGQYSLDELQAKISPLNERKGKLSIELKKLPEQANTPSVSEIKGIATSFADILDRGVYSEIRLTIETLISLIEIDNDDVYIHWKFS